MQSTDPQSAEFLARQQILLSFPDAPAFVEFGDACRFIGISRPTGDHWLSAGTYPVPVTRNGTRKLAVPLMGLHVWLVRKLIEAGYSSETIPPASKPDRQNVATRRRGRPRKLPAAGANK